MKEEKLRISRFISHLDREGFSKTLDTIDHYSEGADLYFRKIDRDGSRYIVINHYAKKLKAENQGFDCWISTYRSEEEIGVTPALKREMFIRAVQIERDWPLISSYLN